MPQEERVAGFVGRHDELASVQRAAGLAADHHPVVILLSGDAGIGKTSLLTEAARRTSVGHLVGRCVPIGGDAVPLAPLSDLVRSLRRSAPELLESDDVAALARWPDVTGTSIGEIFEAVLALLGRLSHEQPTIVVIEDLHWGDAVTWDLFDFLARNLFDEAVVLVATLRAEEVGRDPLRRRRLAEIGRLPIVQRMHLDGLPRADIEARATELLGHPPTHELLERIHTRGGGNPFFTQELVAAEQQGQTLPGALADLIAGDLDAFDVDGRSVLGAIAAVGHGIDHSLLERVVALDADVLEATLRQAVDARLLLVDGDRYRFRHALLGEVAYEQLLPPERRRLHRRIADELAGDASGSAAERGAGADRAGADPERLGELAFHLDRGGDAPAAFTARLAAADAAEVLAPGTALRHLERALALWSAAGPDSTEDRSTRLWQAAELAATTVSNQHAIELAREAMRLGPPAQGAAWAHERLGRYLWAIGDHAASAAEFDAAAAALDAPGPAAGTVATIAGLAQASLMRGHNDDAEAYAARALSLVASPSDHPAAWTMATRVSAVALVQRGELDAGVALARDAVAAAHTANSRVFAQAYLGTVLLHAGRYDEAATAMLDAIAEAHVTGTDASFGGFLAGVGADALVRAGRYAEAQLVLDRFDPRVQPPVGTVRLAAASVLLAGRRGDPVAVQAAVALVEGMPSDPWQRTQLDHAAADAHVACGQWPEARKVAQRALATAMGSLPLWGSRLGMLLTIAEVETALDAVARRDDVDAAEVAASLASTFAPVDGATPPGPMAADRAHLDAELSRLVGPQPARWQEAVARWEDVGDPYWTAVARRHLAEAAFATDDLTTAADALQRAHHTAVELGAARLVADLDAFSRRSRLAVEAPRAPVLAAASVDRLGLTSREAEVLGLVAAGLTNRQIGERLYVSEKTASVHVSNILRKLGVTSRVDAAAIAQRLGVD